MATLSADGSFNKLNYGLRPQKQVERRLILEALHRLMEFGYPISEYTYLGLGSFYYFDFVLFHKYVHIRQMICAESRPIPRRMRFNRPYSFISIKMNPIGSVIPTLSRRRRHLVWLDYDKSLLDVGLADLGSLLGVLAPGSIFLITVNAQTRTADDPDVGTEAERARLDSLYGAHVDEFARYASEDVPRSILSRRNYPIFLADVLRGFIIEEVSRRPGGEVFQQLFNYRYADGAQMLTFGGILADSESADDVAALAEAGVPFVASSEPLEISVPPLTVRERGWLDQHLAQVRRRPEELAFELPAEAAKNYIDFYREYPAYYEAFL